VLLKRTEQLLLRRGQLRVRPDQPPELRRQWGFRHRLVIHRTQIASCAGNDQSAAVALRVCSSSWQTLHTRLSYRHKSWLKRFVHFQTPHHSVSRARQQTARVLQAQVEGLTCDDSRKYPMDALLPSRRPSFHSQSLDCARHAEGVSPM